MSAVPLPSDVRLRSQAVFGTILSALLPNTPLVPAVRAVRGCNARRRPPDARAC